MIGIDTNVLIYAFDNSDRRKHIIAKKLIQNVSFGSEFGILTSQVLAEFAHVIQKKSVIPMSIENIELVLRSFRSSSH